MLWLTVMSKARTGGCSISDKFKIYVILLENRIWQKVHNCQVLIYDKIMWGLFPFFF